MKVEVKFSGAKLGDVAKRVERFAKNAVANGVKELNSGGRAMKAGLKPVLAAQTGLKQGVIGRFMHESQASAGSPIYRLSGSGGNIRDKFFSPTETSSGVDILPRGVPVSIKGAFTKGGSPSNRVALKMGGNVLKRVGSKRGPIKTQHSGVYIAQEFVTGPTLRYYEDSAARIGAAIIRSFTSEVL